MERVQGCKWRAGCPPQPPPLFSTEMSSPTANFPLSEDAKNKHRSASSHKKKKATRKRLGALKRKNIESQSNLPLQGMERLQGVQMGGNCPSPTFLQRLPHKKENATRKRGTFTEKAPTLTSDWSWSSGQPQLQPQVLGWVFPNSNLKLGSGSLQPQPRILVRRALASCCQTGRSQLCSSTSWKTRGKWAKPCKWRSPWERCSCSTN